LQKADKLFQIHAQGKGDQALKTGLSLKLLYDMILHVARQSASATCRNFDFNDVMALPIVRQLVQEMIGLPSFAHFRSHITELAVLRLPNFEISIQSAIVMLALNITAELTLPKILLRVLTTRLLASAKNDADDFFDPICEENRAAQLNFDVHLVIHLMQSGIDHEMASWIEQTLHEYAKRLPKLMIKFLYHDKLELPYGQEKYRTFANCGEITLFICLMAWYTQSPGSEELMQSWFRHAFGVLISLHPKKVLKERGMRSLRSSSIPFLPLLLRRLRKKADELYLGLFQVMIKLTSAGVKTRLPHSFIKFGTALHVYLESFTDSVEMIEFLEENPESMQLFHSLLQTFEAPTPSSIQKLVELSDALQISELSSLSIVQSIRSSIAKLTSGKLV
jgi:hypothetical protein